MTGMMVAVVTLVVVMVKADSEDMLSGEYG